jgi:HEPN domain-containing protein
MRPPEEIRAELVRQWLAKAEEDLGVAEYLVSENTEYFSAAGFHAQQAAEKFLKAVLVHHQIEFPKTHDLAGLLDLISRADPDLALALGDVIGLNIYAVEARYPGDSPEITASEAKIALSLAIKVQRHVLKKLRP